MLAVGDTVDRYVIEAVLGEGGMGRVYRALDPRLGRRVALKVLLTEGASPEARAAAAARMMREARAAAAFNHPNVVAIYDVGEVDGSPYIAMEHVTGGTLRAFIRDERTLDAQKLAWLLDVARGLGAAHRAGLVHRDIKPDNVMITTDGVVKILDFGIARSAASSDLPVESAPTAAANLPSLTGEGMMLGTPQYMAPEQLQGEPLDGRADQFAWGVMAYEVLSGTLPWAASKTGAQLVAAVLSAAARPLGEIVPTLDTRIVSAVARAMSKDKNARYATMDDLVASIDGARSVPVIISTPDLGPSTAETVAQVHPTPGVRTAPTARGARPARTVLLAAGVFCACGIGALLFRGQRQAPVTVALALPDAAPRAVKQSAPPATPQAAEAYEAALQATEDGETLEAERKLEAAAAADPLHAATLLRLTISLLRTNTDEPRRAHDAYEKVLEHRTRLGEIDAAVLDALEPRMREPPALSEYASRMNDVSLRYPSDPMPAFLAAHTFADLGRLDEAAAGYARALAADPKYALALFGQGTLSARRGDLAGGLAPLEQCNRAAPKAIDCYWVRILLLQTLGRCAEMESVARAGVNADSLSAVLQDSVAEASLAKGESIDTVKELLLRAEELATGPSHELTPLQDAERVAEVRGDFAEAVALTKKLDKAAAAAKLPYVAYALRRYDLAAEMGELPAQKDDTVASWNRARAWLSPADPDLLRLAHFAYRAGAISRAELDQRREAWKKARLEEGERNKERVSPLEIAEKIYVRDASDEREAREAIAMLPEDAAYTPDPWEKPEVDRALGMVLARAGAYAAAVAPLTSGVHACDPLSSWLPQARATLWLGVALEHTGDVEGAKSAYGTVIARLGNAKPRSATAAEARARLGAIGK